MITEFPKFGKISKMVSYPTLTDDEVMLFFANDPQERSLKNREAIQKLYDVNPEFRKILDDRVTKICDQGEEEMDIILRKLKERGLL